MSLSKVAAFCQAINSRHGLVDGLDAVSHGELVDDFLSRLVEVDLPGVVPFGCRQLHVAPFLLAQEMEDILKEWLNKNFTGHAMQEIWV